MSLKHFALTALLATIGFTLNGTAAKAESRLDDLSHRLLGQLGQLEREYINTFRGGREFSAGLNDLHDMSAVAAHLHEGVHHNEPGHNVPGRHLRADAEKLEQTFHHFESLVGEMERGPRFARPMHESQMFRRLLTDVGMTVHELREMVMHVHHSPRGPASNGWNSTSANWNGGADNWMTPTTAPAVQTVPMRPGYVVPSVAPVAPRTLPPFGTYMPQPAPPRSSSFGASLSIRL